MNIGASNVRFNSDLDYDGLFSKYDCIVHDLSGHVYKIHFCQDIAMDDRLLRV